MEPDFVAAQIDVVLNDLGAEAVKTGLLASAPQVEAVANKLGNHNSQNLVVDPVLTAKDGAQLLSDEGVKAFREQLLTSTSQVLPTCSSMAVSSASSRLPGFRPTIGLEPVPRLPPPAPPPLPKATTSPHRSPPPIDPPRV